MLQNWSDSETWKSLQDGVATDDLQARATAEITSGWVAQTTLTLDVTESVKEWQSDPTANFGWVVVPTDHNGVGFSSAEGAVPPRLVVQTSGGC